MKRRKKLQNSFLREYGIEILTVIAVIVGWVLIRVERTQFEAVVETLVKWSENLVNRALSIHYSDLIGVVVVLAGMAFILWRVRYHLQKSEHWQVRECPRCKSSIHRIHRTTTDRLLGFLVLPHSRRFRCDNSNCRWTGLRYGRHHTEMSEQDFPVLPGKTL